MTPPHLSLWPRDARVVGWMPNIARDSALVPGRHASTALIGAGSALAGTGDAGVPVVVLPGGKNMLRSACRAPLGRW